MNKTPLHNTHIQLGAKMVNFSNWEMPISYSSLIEEHNAVRNTAGIFDVSLNVRLSRRKLNYRQIDYFPAPLIRDCL